MALRKSLEKKGWATGVSFFDINADGIMDIYVCIANKDISKSENQLYINQGKNKFKEEAKPTGSTITDTVLKRHFSTMIGTEIWTCIF